MVLQSPHTSPLSLSAMSHLEREIGFIHKSEKSSQVKYAIKKQTFEQFYRQVSPSATFPWGTGIKGTSILKLSPPEHSKNDIKSREFTSLTVRDSSTIISSSWPTEGARPTPKYKNNCIEKIYFLITEKLWYAFCITFTHAPLVWTHLCCCWHWSGTQVKWSHQPDPCIPNTQMLMHWNTQKPV